MLYADTPTKRRIGIALGSLTMVFFSILDTCGKWLATHVPLMEVVWFRFAFASLIVLLITFPRGRLKDFWRENIQLQIVRALMMCAMTILNFAGLKYLQLAQANSILFSTPIIIAVLSTVFLKEKLSLSKWLAIAAGFIGVLIILDPFGDEFHPAMFLIIGHACIYALFNLLTRKMASTANPECTIVYSCVLPTLFLIPFMIPVWQTPTDPFDYLVFFLAGLFGFLGHYVLVIAYRYAKPTTISPFFYLQILYMIFLGWLIFHQIPSHHVFLGASIVVASGLYLWFIENKTGKHV
jgi:drug/metabolite transporter (DMT)-like permease